MNYWLGTPMPCRTSNWLKELVKKILTEVKKSTSQADWHKKDDTKALLQLTVKQLLCFRTRAELQEILDEEMEQAEARAGYSELPWQELFS